MNEKKASSTYAAVKAGVEKNKFNEYIYAEYVSTIEDEELPKDKPQRALKAFTTNLNTKVTQGKIDPVIGRQEELETICLSLGRRLKNNCLLVGDPGVGKTAIAEVWLYRIVNKIVLQVFRRI